MTACFVAVFSVVSGGVPSGRVVTTVTPASQSALVGSSLLLQRFVRAHSIRSPGVSASRRFPTLATLVVMPLVVIVDVPVRTVALLARVSVRPQTCVHAPAETPANDTYTLHVAVPLIAPSVAVITTLAVSLTPVTTPALTVAIVASAVVHVAGLKIQHTKNARGDQPSKYARFALEDLAGRVDCVMWPDSFAKFGERLVEDAIVYVQAEVKEQREHPELVVGRVVPVADGPASLARGLALQIPASAEPSIFDKLSLVLARFKGPPTANRVPVYIVVTDDRKRTAELKAADDWSVHPPAVVTAELEEITGPGSVKFMGGRRPPPAERPGERPGERPT